MVYCGKPSKGCSNCRERKIRCDQREPGCGQCEKRQQECPGYRNLVDLMFRDESSHVIKKAKAKARKKATLLGEPASSPDIDVRPSVTPEPRGKPLSLITPNTRSPDGSTDKFSWLPDDSSLLPSPDSGSWPTTPPMLALLYNLAPTWQERGTAYFFSRYVTIDDNCCHQRFDFVYDVWKPATRVPERQVDGVLASMTAVGLLGLASLTRSNEVMEAARKSYGTALRLTNDALRSPTEAVKDTTMLSVLILGLFEMQTENSSRTLKAFQEHVNGAAALAKMRGVDQFKTAGGMKMFMMLCQRVMISCIQKETPMPQLLLDLRKDMSQFIDSNDPTWQISDPIYKVLQVRSDIKQGKIARREDIIDTLVQIEGEFEQIMVRFTPEWRYKIFRVTRRHPAIYEELCHLYPSLVHATVWNGIRTMRMLVLETILSEIHQDLHSDSPQLSGESYGEEFHRAKAKLERMTEAIIASVPQHLGLINPSDTRFENLTPTSTPITTVEIRETPSPPTSPSSRSPGSSTGSDGPKTPRRDPPGLTVIDPLRGRDADDEAERFMVLASATNTIVWPLYMVGMSSVCTPEMKMYAIDRLRTLYMETSLKQADDVANLLEDHDHAWDWLEAPVTVTEEVPGLEYQSELPSRGRLYYDEAVPV